MKKEIKPMRLGVRLEDSLSGVFSNAQADALIAAAKELQMIHDRAEAGTKLYPGGDPARGPGIAIPEGMSWIEIQAVYSADYAKLWERARKLGYQVSKISRG